MWIPLQMAFIFNFYTIFSIKQSSDEHHCDLSYKVEWQATDDAFDDRFKSYLNSSFFEHQIHWFSIINSFMMVILLVGFVTLILIRTLKNDFAKVIYTVPTFTILT